MKKDTLYIVGGLAVGAVLFYAFKDKILPKKAKSAPEATAEGEEVVIVAQQEGDASQTAPAQETQAQAAPQALPYALTKSESELRAFPSYSQLFGGCTFPIEAGSSGPCVDRIQDAFDVAETGVFDVATQEALDDFIESTPNRSQGYFSGYSNQGCIFTEPSTGEEVNLCGLNHDQYLDILFKMGIPITG